MSFFSKFYYLKIITVKYFKYVKYHAEIFREMYSIEKKEMDPIDVQLCSRSL